MRRYEDRKYHRYCHACIILAPCLVHDSGIEPQRQDDNDKTGQADDGARELESIVLAYDSHCGTGVAEKKKKGTGRTSI